MDVINISFSDIAQQENNSDLSWANNIVLYDIDALSEISPLDSTMPPIRIEGVCFFFCKYGEISFTIDYKPRRLTRNMMLGLHSRHIVENIHVSANSKGYMLALSQKLIQSIIGDIPIIKKLIMSANHRSIPFEKLDEDEMRQLTDILERIKKSLKSSNHAFQSQIIKNEASNLILEAANIRLKKVSAEDDIATEQETRNEEVAHAFIQLLFEYCKKQHEVSFYATKLCMTSGNLCRIMKSSTGKSPLRWISDALIAESKILMHKKNTNIQQVSEELHFSDQSSFGKFFKKHTGFTPIEYKNKIHNIK